MWVPIPPDSLGSGSEILNNLSVQDYHMILFGAGSSVPFGIPGMTGFTTQFIEESKDISHFIGNLEDAINQSQELIGISLSFDLETLLSVLNDLSSEKKISIPTASLLLREGLNTKEARARYGEDASSTLKRLREFIFRICMKPIKKGREEGNFGFLDRFYGPLMTVLNGVDLKNIQGHMTKTYSTNWDLCFKTWVDYVNIPINDGTSIDKQSYPILDVGKFSTGHANRIDYVPLHGSLDFIKMQRPKGRGIYKDISKISDPVGYFEDKPTLLKNVFMIYPLEAIGYEESIKSPYLDMINTFRLQLGIENIIFIIGYSLRDPTIGSIFEEVIGERIRAGHLNLLSGDLDSRKKEVKEHSLKIVVVNPNPDKLIENLKKQAHTNLSQTFVPIKIEFPTVTDGEFKTKYTRILRELVDDLIEIDHLSEDRRRVVFETLETTYRIMLRT